ncbi:adenosylmethionine decarboxylase [bacterium]|nr:adenosylmethionine decarboxylase [bacterium]MBU1636879.1 adenosylmethionine decarboxylase [bacterium]
MKALGQQTSVEYYKCNPEILNDVSAIKRAMREAANLAGATIVQEAFHLFNPHGVSGVVVIAESHFAIHTWPEYGYAAVDLFTCGDDVDSELAFLHLRSELQASDYTAVEMKRGLLNINDPERIVHKPARELVEA